MSLSARYFHDRLISRTYVPSRMSEPGEWDEALITNAKVRYCAAVEANNDTKRLPETPSKSASAPKAVA